MNINLPKASELSGHVFPKNRKKTLDEIIEKWINSKLVPEIRRTLNSKGFHSESKEAGVCFVSVEPPWSQSSNNEFYERLDEVLAPLGYTTYQSHDGAGVYTVVAVEWPYKSGE